MKTSSPLNRRRSIQQIKDSFVQRDRREEIEPCAVTERDIDILIGLWRLKFLTTSQIAALWFNGANEWAWRRRLLKLFRSGLSERFRPNCIPGSHEWTYVLSRDGYDLLRGFNGLPEDAPWIDRTKIGFSYVMHDLELNGWLIEIKETANADFQGLWGEAESKLQAPVQEIPKGQLALGTKWLIDGIKLTKARNVIPDAMIQLVNSGRGGYVRYLVEFDRTRRADELRHKLDRYDLLLNWWWQLTEHGESHRPPQVIFVCKDEDHLRLYLDTADRELQGRRRKIGSTKGSPTYRGREWIFFCLESDAYEGSLKAWQVKPRPTADRRRKSGMKETCLVR